MRQREYKAMTLKQMQRWECRLTREIKTGQAVYPGRYAMHDYRQEERVAGGW